MNKQLHDKARDIHNSQSKEMRNLLCISSAHTQVITLLQLKEQIMDDAKKRCAEIDVWITNIENTSNGLRECIAEYESAIDAQMKEGK